MINVLLNIDGTDYLTEERVDVNKVESEYNTISNFIARFDNYIGRYSSTFSLNEDVLITSDIDTSPPTTKIFRGIIENIRFVGEENKEMVEISGRDYGAILQDIIVTPRIFKNTEAGEIIKSLMRQNATGTGITHVNVSTTLTTIPKITFNGNSLFDAIRQVANVSGYYFYVDEDKDLNFKKKEDVSSGITFGTVPMSDPILHYKMNDNAANTTVDDAMGTYDGTSQRNTNLLSTDGKLISGLGFNGVVGGGLEAHWKFNESGTYVSGATTGYLGSVMYDGDFGDGKIGSSFLLAGSMGHLKCDDIGSIMVVGSDTAFTATAWINTTGSGWSISGTSQAIIGGAPGTNVSICLGNRTGTESARSRIECFTDDSSIATSDDIVGSNTWHHIAASCLNSPGSPYYPEWNIYLDGNLVKTGSYIYQTGDPPTAWSPGHIGYDNRYKFGFNGGIDDVRIYNRILDNDEVKSIYNDGNGTEDEEDYIEMDGSSIRVTSNDHALAFWYKTTKDYFQMLFQNTLASTNSNIELRPADNSILVESYTNNLWDKGFATGIDVDDGEWHHYTFVFNTTDSRLYVDGNLAEIETENTDAEDFGYRYIGGAGNTYYTYGQTPNGDFDDVRIYDAAITATMVTSIYNKGLGTEDQNPEETASRSVLSASFQSSDDDIFNEVKVLGGRQETFAQEEFITGTDNTGSVYTLSAKPYNVKVQLSGTPNVIYQPGGILNISNPATDTAQFLVDFQSKQIVLTSGTTAGDNTVPAGSVMIFDFFRSTPLIKNLKDTTSIAAYGLKKKEIVDKNVIDLDEATDIAETFIAEHKDPKIVGNMDILGILNVTPGETCVVNIPNHNQSSQTYSMIKANYKFSKRNCIANNALKITVNKKVSDFIDLIKEHELRLRALEVSETESSITNFELFTGSIGISGTCTVIQKGIGSAFYFNITGHDILESPSSLLGVIEGGSVVQVL